MYFDFDDRYLETPTIEPAMSWRERGLLSVFAHAVVILLAIFGPRLPFMQELAERQAQRLEEMAAEQMAMRQEPEADRPDFIFVEPRVDTPAPEAPPVAALSDIDRQAQSPVQAENPLNDLPNAEGNTFEFVETEELSDGLDEETSEGDERDLTASADAETVDGIDDGADDVPPPEAPDPDPGDGGALSNPFLADGPAPRPDLPPTLRPGAIVNQALRGLDSLARGRSFTNDEGRTEQHGPDIQFDSKGVDFGSWLRRFRAQIYRNWLIPYAAMSMSGHVVLTFNIHTDGTLTELTVKQPSTVDAFTNSAFNAMSWSNPTYPLPPEYPDESVLFTVIFYFNELPPRR